ncbi:Protein strictosidine synthase-like 2 [Vitis vinifera]|uniref:Protein strictosidine synthase-like 2 n=1 Tax=Vitis vinifera TaxID=29760 RepID=A0A438DKK1_VITVI|nr:Protein strictosidine synthase-like 2 [Vitis vinifera]
MAMSSKLLLAAAAAAAFLITALIAGKRTSLSSPEFDSEKFSNQKDAVIPIPTPGAIGPESLAFDSVGGGPYTGVSDGRIIKWEENEERWVDFATTSSKRIPGSRALEHICGRPLGLSFSELTGELYIADAYMGLLVVGPNGGLASTVASEAQGTPFGFSNGVDIHQTNGAVYFSDSSSRYQRRKQTSNSSSPESRVSKWSSVEQNGDFILLSETSRCRILRFWLQTSKAGTVEVFTLLPGFPDNIKRNSKGEFWVGMHSRKGKLVEWFLSYPWIGRTLLKLPFPHGFLSFFSKWRKTGFAVRLSEEGEVLEIFEPKNGNGWISSISEVYERDGSLWIGSVTTPCVGKYEMQT